MFLLRNKKNHLCGAALNWQVRPVVAYGAIPCNLGDVKYLEL